MPYDYVREEPIDKILPKTFWQCIYSISRKKTPYSSGFRDFGIQDSLLE